MARDKQRCFAIAFLCVPTFGLPWWFPIQAQIVADSAKQMMPGFKAGGPLPACILLEAESGSGTLLKGQLIVKTLQKMVRTVSFRKDVEWKCSGTMLGFCIHQIGTA